MLDASLPALTGNVLWLDAADNTTILDADGDSAATGTGGANNGFAGTVGTWVDKSSSNYNVTSAGSAMPQYGVDTLNGKNVLKFDGVDDRLSNVAATIAGSDYSAFVVYQRTTTSGRANVFEIEGPGSRNGLYLNDGSGPNKYNYYLNGSFYNSTVNYTASAYTLADIVQAGTSGSVNINGTNVITATTGARITTTGVYVGDDSTSGDFLQGDIAELVIYNRALTSDERHDVENYLANKWGLSITNTAPTISANTGGTVAEGSAQVIISAMLAATDADNTDSTLLYTVTNAVDRGTLTNTNTGLTIGLNGTFTQADINNGYITYTHDGSETTFDYFEVTVSDGLTTTASAAFNCTITPVNEAPVFGGWTLVSSENFESGATGWSDNTTTNGGSILTNFLGRHSQEAGAQLTSKTYNLSGMQDYVTISFDMYEIDSWDGENFYIYIDNLVAYNVSLSQSTLNSPADGSSGAVSWLVQETTTSNVNFVFGGWVDQTYHYELRILSTASTIKLGFSSTLNQGVTDEAWGVDNVRVYEVSEGGVPGPLNVSESAANGTGIGSAIATDPDLGSVLTYSIIGGTGAGVFSINSSTGAITVSNAAALNYEVTPSYTLTVQVTDNGTPSLSDTETITINVLDVPENTAPVLNALGPLSVSEAATAGTALGTMTSSDAEGNTVTYSITGGNTDNLFSINSSSGAITLSSTALLNYERQNVYTLTIQGTDNGFTPLSSTRNVTINITNANEAPTFTPEQQVFFANPTLNLVYNATSGNFYRYISTATILSTATSNATASLLYGFAGYLATSTSASENATLTGMITTSTWLGGRDAAAEGQWLWHGGPEAGQMFWLGNAAGSAQNGFYTNWNGSEPNDSGGEDGMEILTSGLWNDINIMINRPYIIEWTGAPILANFSNGPYTLAENSSAGASVGFAHAGDPDAGDTLSFSITGGTGAGSFAINSTTGQISLTNAAAANYELATSYTLDLRVQDTGGLFSTVTVTINIADVNEAPVLNSNTGVTLNEGASTVITNTMLLSSDIDAPPDSALIYTITNEVNNGTLVNTNTGLALGLGDSFTQGDIDNGYIQYTHDDSETTSDAFTFTVTDGALSVPAATFNINVTPVNEIPVYSMTGPYSLVENSALGALAGAVTALDPDTGDVLAYSITGGTGAGAFAINAGTGAITLTNVAAANYEMVTSYTLDVRVQDIAGLFSTVTVTINILDANDTPTDIALTNNQVTENDPFGTIVGSLSSVDEDVADTHIYSLVSNPGSKFMIVGGQLQIAGHIDYEATQFIHLIIRSDDGHGGIYDEAFTINVINLADSFVAPPATGSGPVISHPEQPSVAGNERRESVLRETLRGGAEGQEAAFYGLGSFLQILRENTTFQLRKIASLLDKKLDDGTSYLFGRAGGAGHADNISDYALTHEEHYTNVRQALEFLNSVEDSNDALKDNHTTPVEKEIYNPLQRQFVDVMTYHEQRQAHLRKALLSNV